MAADWGPYVMAIVIGVLAVYVLTTVPREIKIEVPPSAGPVVVKDSKDADGVSLDLKVKNPWSKPYPESIYGGSVGAYTEDRILGENTAAGSGPWETIGYLTGTISGSQTVLPLFARETATRNRYDYRTVYPQGSLQIPLVISTRSTLTEQGATLSIASLGSVWTVNMYWP